MGTNTKVNNKRMFTRFSRLRVSILNYFSIHGRRTERAYDLYTESFNMNRNFDTHKEIWDEIDHVYEANKVFEDKLENGDK